MGEACGAGVRGERESERERAGQLCVRSARRHRLVPQPQPARSRQEPRGLEVGGSRGPRGARSPESGGGGSPEPQTSPSRERSGAARPGSRASVRGGSPLAPSRPRRGFLLPSFQPRRRWTEPQTRRRSAPTMSLNRSASAPQGANALPLPPSGLEAALLDPGSGNSSGNASEPIPAVPSSDLDVNTDIYSKALVTAVYLALFAVGTVGNAVTAFTLARKKPLQQLQSTVHYHLGSLALSDLLILLLAMPVELYNFIWVHHPWAFGDAACRGYYFLRDACTYATALNVASLSAERYLAICHPFKAKTVMSRSRTKKFIGAIWLAAGLLAVPMLFTMGQQNLSADGQHPGGLVCTPIVGTATMKVVIQVSSRSRERELERDGGVTWGQGRQAHPQEGLSSSVSFTPNYFPVGVCSGYREQEKSHHDILLLGSWEEDGVGPGPREQPERPLPACHSTLAGPQPPSLIPSFYQRGWEPQIMTSLGATNGPQLSPDSRGCQGNSRASTGLFLERVPFISFSKIIVSPKGSVCLLCSRCPRLLPSVSRLPCPRPRLADGAESDARLSLGFPICGMEQA